MAAIEREIKKAALEMGFSHIGFSRAGALPDAPLLEWLYRGYHGTMTYMEREPDARLDPEKIFPGCQTIISAALNYYTPFPAKAHSAHARVSRYAWGKDYHKVMRKKLKKLAGEILEITPHAKMKICVDTSPVMEKIWAQKGGIGWQGKHSNLISKDYGSWLFLGEILTNLELEPDPPYTDFCGSCSRCMDACPTRAITSPYVVDASKCISYLTIEAKEPASGRLAEESGDWIFGCDICQDVCPWNKFARTTLEEDFFPKLENQRTLLSWMELTEEEFSNIFSGTPFMRPKRKHMAQNAAVALQNLEEEMTLKPRKLG